MWTQGHAHVYTCAHTHTPTQAQEHSITSKTMPDKERSKRQGPFYQWLFALSNTDRSSELYFLLVQQPITLFPILQWSLYLHQIKWVLFWFGFLIETRIWSGRVTRTKLPPPGFTSPWEMTGEQHVLCSVYKCCLSSHLCTPPKGQTTAAASAAKTKTFPGRKE